MSIETTAEQRDRARELARVLRVVEAGNAWREADGTSVETDIEAFGVSAPIGDITKEMALAEAAGLADAWPIGDGEFRWHLTQVGEAILAGLDGVR